MKEIDTDFSPSIIHPYYFIRNGLKAAVQQKAHYLKGRLMDFGCGSKPYKAFFSVKEYIGVDYENEGHPHFNEQIDVFYNGKNLPFENESFDSILCSEVFEHVFNLPEILLELNRVLIVNGHILITCPFVWNEHEVPHDYARYTRYALKSLLEKSGFEIVDYSKAGNFITTTTQMITLYFTNQFKGVWRRVFILRWIYKFCFFLVPNLIGVILNRLLPSNDTLYLNNVIVAKKVVSNA
ncbi:MAG: hypothetical protein C4329_06700 [Chitinophagaceae bacterium]